MDRKLLDSLLRSAKSHVTPPGEDMSPTAVAVERLARAIEVVAAAVDDRQLVPPADLPKKSFGGIGPDDKIDIEAELHLDYSHPRYRKTTDLPDEKWFRENMPWVMPGCVKFIQPGEAFPIKGNISRRPPSILEVSAGKNHVMMKGAEWIVDFARSRGIRFNDTERPCSIWIDESADVVRFYQETKP